jgi:hypothetical protein
MFDQYPIPSYYGADFFLPGGGGEPSTAQNHRITLMYGRNFGETPFGATVTYVNSSEKWDGFGGPNHEFGITMFNIQAGLTLADGMMDIAGGFTTMSWTDELNVVGDDATEIRTEPSGNVMIDLLGRYWMEMDDDWTGVPHVEIKYMKQGLDDVDEFNPDNDPVEFRWTDLMIGIGYGLNYEPTDNVLLAGDAGLQMANMKYEINDGSSTDESKDTRIHLPYFRIGFEAGLLSWLTGRVGVESIWDWGKIEGFDTEEITVRNAKTQTFAGVTFNWGNWLIDAGLNNDFLSEGPYFIGGDSVDGDLFPAVSILYNFESAM